MNNVFLMEQLDKDQKINYQIIHNQVTTQINTPEAVFLCEGGC